MKTETLEHLVAWAGAIHQALSERLNAAADHTADGPEKWFVEYAAKHETEITREINGIPADSNRNALGTWVYDWLDQPLQSPERIVGDAGSDASFDAITRAVFESHKQVMDLFRHVLARADIPEARELIERVLDLEEGQTRLMAQQMNRIRDM